MDRAQIQLSRGVGRGLKAKRIRQGQGVAGGQQFSAGGVDNNAVVDLLGRKLIAGVIGAFIDDSAGLIKLFIAAFDGGFRFCLIAVPFCAVAVLVFRTKIVPRGIFRNADPVTDIENLRFSRNVVAALDRKSDRTVGVGCANRFLRYIKVFGCRNLIVWPAVRTMNCLSKPTLMRHRTISVKRECTDRDDITYVKGNTSRQGIGDLQIFRSQQILTGK